MSNCFLIATDKARQLTDLIKESFVVVHFMTNIHKNYVIEHYVRRGRTEET